MSDLWDKFRQVELGQSAYVKQDVEEDRGDYFTAPEVAYVDEIVHLEKRREHEGLLRYIRKQRFPDLFKQRYPKSLIDTWQKSTPPPPGVQAWIEEYLLEAGDPKDKFRAVLDPAFNRWCIFELVRNPQNGGATYYRSLMVAEDPKEGELPPDYDEARFRHHRGKIGAYRQINKQDVWILRHYADRRLPIEEFDRRQDAHDKQVEADKQREREARLHDLHDYYFLHINRAANGGTKQHSVEDRSAHVKPAHLGGVLGIYEEQRQGFKIRTRASSRYADKLRADQELREKIEAYAAGKDDREALPAKRTVSDEERARRDAEAHEALRIAALNTPPVAPEKIPVLADEEPDLGRRHRQAAESVFGEMLRP